MRSFKNAKIDVVIFPPHMTHIMQPFDRVIARPLKDCLGRIARAMINEVPELTYRVAYALRASPLMFPESDGDVEVFNEGGKWLL
jgi:hypothetical protein